MRPLLLAMVLFITGTQGFAQNSGGMASGELVLRAFQASFPGKTGEVVFAGGDWTISAGGETFFWAGGRLLPRTEKDNTGSWDPHFFYEIPQKARAPETYPPQYIEALRARASSEQRLERKDTNKAFLAVLYGGLERREIESLLERIDFLGKRVTVHSGIAGALARVEAEIRKWEGGSAFIASLGSIDGYSWRPIAGTQRMSYHSWGLALDIQPSRLGGKAIYWLWEQGRNRDWMLVPLEKRWNPPDEVIAAFEREGFIWGGKWPVYDNMHFEYRPELHEYSRLIKSAAAESAASTGRDLHHIYPDTLREAGSRR
ncbi:MAG: M15 family metallopeptidase [Treponema sp.]|nr:M15 family metallopeptidase [Treponema sp.]